MTNYEWLKTLSVEDLAKVLTELSEYYEEEQTDNKELFAGPSGWQMSKEEALQDYKEWLEADNREGSWHEVLNDK